MTEEKETLLYCTHCEKQYRVSKDAIALMMAHSTTLRETAEGYRYDEGCFFKTLANLKREQSRRDKNVGQQ